MIRLRDHDAREQIKTALGQSMMVEAAAGTGKTTELVNRIVNVIAQGRARISEIVAVTFADKAAGELKLRLRSRLEQERQAERSQESRSRLLAAAEDLEEAHISTIHGFCADLLRSRPVEARIDPLFESLDGAAARRLYHEAFDRWLEEKLDNPPEGVRRALRRRSRDNDDDPSARLRRAGWELAQWRDYSAPWRKDPFAREAEIDRLVESLLRFAELTASPAKKTDPFYADTRKARRSSDDIRLMESVRSRDYDGLEAEFASLAARSDDETRKFHQCRTGFGAEYARGLARDVVLGAHQEFLSAVKQFAQSADADLAALLHAELQESIGRYDRLKVRAGRLDFLDLLVRARDLMRDCGPVRTQFQRRFKCIFVDEFQDADPLQVEILLLLSASDPSVCDWREVAPEPGKLFIVGDPKQAIYRFRRADLGIYQKVKDLMTARGALCVELTTSFRAVPSIQTAVNAAFAPAMTGDRAALQAAYVPLSSHREEIGGQPTVTVLPVPDPYGKNGKLAANAIERSLPDATAAFLSWLIRESGWKVTESGRPDERVPIAARHICLLFRRFESWGTDVTRGYVAALEARDIPHLLVGGKSFHEREEVQALRVALTAIEWPDDELSVFATLKGSLFAVGDNALIEYRQRYGRLHPFRLPKDPAPPDLATIPEALQILGALHRNRNHRPVGETVARLLDATRAYAGFVFWPSGGQVLANVLYVGELARIYEEQGGISFRGFVELLREEAESGQAPEAPTLEEESDGVRIMTVHKAKGLEFPVVILADITAKLARQAASRYLDTELGLSAVEIGGWSPVELIEHGSEEAERDRAEGVRVAYVAATRARDLLVVPAVGDDPAEQRWEAAKQWWVSPLYRIIYPEPERRRPTGGAEAQAAAASAPECPKFGDDSVRRRASGKTKAGNVAPGLHSFTSPCLQSARSGSTGHEVVWWDPHQLKLDVEPRFGVRPKELLNEIDPAIVAEDSRAHASWQEGKLAALERGSQPSLVVTTATEYANSNKLPAPGAVIRVEGAPRSERPAGPRYGALVHAVLATVSLDAAPEAVKANAVLQGRILGATADEVASAADAVEAALRHPLIDRARKAALCGSCRRETPVTVTLADSALIEGVVDLAFLANGAWTVIDFKTDRELEKRLDVYRRQVQIYAEAITLATGLPCNATLMRV